MRKNQLYTPKTMRKGVIYAYYEEKTFLSAVHRKLALLMSFCVRKVDFPALVR